MKLTRLFIKLSAMILLACALQASGASFSQGITVSARKMTLKSLFLTIEKQTGYEFVFSSNASQKGELNNLNFSNEPLATVLDKCLGQLSLTYTITDKVIMVLPAQKQPAPATKEPVVMAAVPASIGIHGRVTNEQGQPLFGASVVVQGKGTGTSTDEKGEFSVNLSDGEDVLQISLIGYATQTVHVKNKTQLSIILRQLPSSLSEVVVVGYGTQRKVDLTGAVSTVGATQLADRPVTNLNSAIQGTMPGVTVMQNNGQPGRDIASININGIGTLNSTAPLVVVDGIVSSMNEVNPNDVESISVLKDAASAAIYGSRAANGVILITTKKGHKGTSQIEYDAYVGMQTPTRLPDYLPSWQAATMYNQALANVNKAPVYTPADIQAFKDGSDPIGHPNTDWLGLFYHNKGLQQNHYLSVTGGTDKTQYLFSLGYFDQEGNVEKTQAQRYTTRLNLTTQVANHLKAMGNISYTFNPFQEPLSSYPGVSDFSQMIRQVNRISPMVPLKWANGDYAYIGDGNPIAWLNSPSLGTYNHYLLTGSGSLDWEIIPNLHLRPFLGYTLTQDQNKSYVADMQFYTATGNPGLYQGPNSVTDKYDNTTYVTLQATADYMKKWGAHTFKILGGYSQELTKYYELVGYRQGFLNNDLSDLNAASVNGQTSSGYSYEVALQSFFGRFNYDYDGKYLFEANLRYDGTSRFDTATRFGTFPSLSAGWRISKEKFFQPVRSIVPELKLRGSWGRLGNQNITGSSADATYYPYITTVSTGQNYVFGGANPAFAPGVAPVNGANTSLKWETTTETDLGIDAGFLNGALVFSADYFVKNTAGILLDIPVSAPYGLNPPYQNGGDVQNKGWEFTAGYHGREGAFTYNISGNAAFIKNKVISLDGTGPDIGGITIIKEGLPINSFWGYEAQGIFQNQQEVAKHATQNPNTGPGDIIYKDLNNDGKVDQTNDRTYLGTYFPVVTYGFNLGAGWKGIDFTAFFQGAAGVKGYAQGIAIGQVGTSVGKPTSAMLNSWTPSNPNASFPRLLTTSYLQNDPGTNPSSFWVRNASYLRLKNLQIGYSLPGSAARRVGAQRIRVYFSSQNLLTFSHFYKWIDPEAPAGTGGYDYPQIKTTTFGLNVTF